MASSRNFLSPVKDFIGCISEVHFDHVALDLNNVLQDKDSMAGCPPSSVVDGGDSCTATTCTSNENGICSVTLDGPKCECFTKYVGKNCQTSKSSH